MTVREATPAAVRFWIGGGLVEVIGPHDADPAALSRICAALALAGSPAIAPAALAAAYAQGAPPAAAASIALSLSRAMSRQRAGLAVAMLPGWSACAAIRAAVRSAEARNCAVFMILPQDATPEVRPCR
jgi:hypothetical protein